MWSPNTTLLPKNELPKIFIHKENEAYIIRQT
jgi:hypothetical protein